MKTKINLARLDTRLLHGQVATNWTPASKADRIIVASDDVAKDEFLQRIDQTSSTNGVKANVVPIQNWLMCRRDPASVTHALILFEINDTYRRWRANQKNLTLVLWLT